MKNILRILIAFTIIVNYGCVTRNVVKEPVFKGKLINFGILDAYGSRQKKDGDSDISSTYYDPASQFEVYTTDTIPLQKNIHFGIVWSASCFTSDKDQIITLYVDHPPMTLPSGNVTTSSTQDVIVKPINGFVSTINGYILEEDFELVPGTWTLSIRYQGELLVSKTFSVIKIKP